MAKLGSSKRPLVFRVQTSERAQEALAQAQKHGMQAIVGIEPEKPEDISDLERALCASTVVRSEPKSRPNDPCPCGSGQKHKKCCGRVTPANP